jgi:hypothetical protein
MASALAVVALVVALGCAYRLRVVSRYLTATADRLAALDRDLRG